MTCPDCLRTDGHDVGCIYPPTTGEAMTQHTDERDAYEHIVRQMPYFHVRMLNKSNGDYTNTQIQFGWQIFQTARLMDAKGDFHA